MKWTLVHKIEIHRIVGVAVLLLIRGMWCQEMVTSDCPAKEVTPLKYNAAKGFKSCSKHLPNKVTIPYSSHSFSMHGVSDSAQMAGST